MVYASDVVAKLRANRGIKAGDAVRLRDQSGPHGVAAWVVVAKSTSFPDTWILESGVYAVVADEKNMELI